MSHLSFETIARLVDEQPSALDSAHLSGCSTCRAELETMRVDVASLGDLPDLIPAPQAWDQIEARLEAEGLLRPSLQIKPRTRSYYMPLARAAAIAVIFAGGALAGRASAGTSYGPVALDNGAPTAATTNSNATSDHIANADPNVPISNTGRAIDASPTSTSTSTSTQPPRSARLASTGNALRNTAQNGSRNANDSDGALRTLRAAEDKYFSALSKYSEKAGTESSDPNARLAALEGIVLTTRAALAQSPTDPVINGYHLTALAQRDAMLKQIKATPATTW